MHDILVGKPWSESLFKGLRKNSGLKVCLHSTVCYSSVLQNWSLQPAGMLLTGNWFFFCHLHPQSIDF